ncbi:MAG: hypothetical protein JO019_00620 [Candidatus Kaiserbacteria bacterium]|nr:hypothetical protein [Candidatus Kaiserbacteria bacterium]
MKKALKISKYIPSEHQAKLNLFVSKRRISLAIEHPYERLARQALLALLLIFILAYIYFVAASVLNIMARKEANAQTASLQSAIASMETQYFALSQEVTPASAGDIGLAPLAETHYVYRPGNAASAALDTMGRNAI